MKKIAFLMLCLCSCFLAFYIVQNQERTTSTEASWQEIVEYTKAHLPHEGKLVAKSDGFVYLKVDDRYIHELFSMLRLRQKGFREPPYFRGHKSPGAHISVFYGDENVKPDEAGKSFHFDPTNIILVHTSTDTYAILQVSSPELEALRKKYDVSPKLHGHGFHISIAKKAKID